MPRRAGTRRAGQRSSGAHRPRDLPVGIALLLGVPLVVELLSLAECHRHLRDAAFEVELEGNQGETLALDRTYETPDLPLVQQQLSRPGRLVVVVAGPLVRRDVQIEQEDLAVAHDPVCIGQIGLPVAQRLDLASREHQPCLVGVQNGIVVTRTPILGDRDVLWIVVGLGHGRETVARVRRTRVRPQHRPRATGKQRNALTGFAMPDNFSILYSAPGAPRMLGWWNW